MAGFKPIGLTFNRGDWDKLRIIIQHLGAQELPSLVVYPTGVLERDTDVTSSDFGVVTLNYNTDQFDILSNELHIMHFHTPDTRITVIGVDTEDNPGTDCTFLGFTAGKTNTNLAADNIGTNNTYLGSKCGTGTITGSQYASFANTGVGNKCLENISGGFRNAALGYYALGQLKVGGWSANPGSYNVALGAFCAGEIIGGHNNMAQGYFALGKGKFPIENVAIGSDAGWSVSASWGDITAFADAGGGQVTVTSAGHGRSNGDEVEICGTTSYTGTFTVANALTNTFEITDTFVADDVVGYWYATNEGIGNVLVGRDASQNLTTGNYNTNIGYGVGITLTTADGNVLVGYKAGELLVTGAKNVCIGYNAGGQETGSNKLYIHNSNSATPLIGGDFNAGTVVINGSLTSTDDMTMQGHLFTLGNGAATDIVLQFDGSANDGTITFDESAGLFDFGSSHISTTGRLTVFDVVFTTGGQDFLFTSRSNTLAIQGQSASTDSIFEIYNKDGDGTDSTGINIWNKGTPGSITNRQLLQVNITSGNYAQIRTLNGGTGTLFPIYMASGTTYPYQLVIGTLGNVGIGKVPTSLNRLEVAYTTIFDGNVILGNNKYLYLGGTGMSLRHDGTNGRLVMNDGGFYLTGSSRFGDGGATNYVEISATGDMVFVGSSGLCFGEISYHGAGFNTALAAQDTYYQILGFDTNGESNNCTPDHTNDHITITKAGVYECSLSISCRSAESNEYEFHVFKNNGATEFSNIGLHETTDVAGKTESISAIGLIDLAVNDTIEVWVQRLDGGAVSKTLTTENITLDLVQIGG